MEKDTTIILDLRRRRLDAIEFSIALDCYYPVTMDEKKKGDLAERIVTIGYYKDLEEAKSIGREMWKEYSKDAMKELMICKGMIPVFKFDNFQEFK